MEYRTLRLEWNAAELLEKYPPKPKHAGKKILFRLSCAVPPEPRGTIVLTQWKRTPLPAALPPELPRAKAAALRRGSFDYCAADDGAGAFAWHVNFADKALFGFWGDSLFAQDELQVAEHPLLACVRDAAGAPKTVRRGQPTPVLVRGVERRCVVDVAPDAARGRPRGLYGREFARAAPDAVEAAVRLLRPPTLSNIVAIAAPSCGRGRYTLAQLRFAVETAFTGFHAAVLESPREDEVVVHTGAWGTGAFGGNRVLMAIVQLVAARAAGVRLVFHAVDDENADAFRQACDSLDFLVDGLDSPVSSEALLAAIDEQGFKWGESDGN